MAYGYPRRNFSTRKNYSTAGRSKNPYTRLRQLDNDISRISNAMYVVNCKYQQAYAVGANSRTLESLDRRQKQLMAQYNKACWNRQNLYNTLQANGYIV